ncbi:MAG: acyltransferase [Microbacteriaceae bacterium]|nr:acyltransferase [Microbacteriaceae bacterium]
MSSSKSAIRVDIQLLRAAAVLSVVAFHFWPNRVVSGFAGVDVFFVISGFLITALIVREVESTGKLSLVNFWMRRIRRILPASIVVIAATAGVVMWIGSSELLESIGRHVFASAFSGENILLALDQADYFRSAEAPSPLQHFWSLAVEEQFYFVWPVVVLLVVAVTRTFSQTVRALNTVIVSIVIASAAFAVFLTAVNEPSGYYNSLARAWELGLGAFVAILGARGTPRLSAGVATVINRVAWVLLLATFAIPNLESGVPSWGVAPAVILTAVVIATGNRRPATATNVVARTVRGVGQWVGDRSFSLYLWHWPILILAPYVLKVELTAIHKILAIALAFVLSEVSYRFIETPVRISRRPMMRNPLIVAPLAGLTSAALVASVSFAAVALTPPPVVPFNPGTASSTDSSFFDEERVMRKGLDVTGVSRYCDGAGAWLFDCDTENDRPRSGAVNSQGEKCDRIEPCENGNSTSPITVAFVGDSHARELRTAMDLVGKLLDWRIVSFTMSTCPLGSLTAKPDCHVRDAQLMKRVRAGEFDLVITSQLRSPSPTEEEYVSVFNQILETGTPLATFRDNPVLDDETIGCKRVNFSDPNMCEFTPSAAFRIDDPAANVATKLGIHIIDMSTVFCHDDVCPLAIGGLRVYRDKDHVNREFNETMAPLIAADLAGARLIRTE